MYVTLLHTSLYLGYGSTVAVAQRCDGKVQLPLIIPLTEEFFAYFLTPLLAHVPGAARVGDVSALEGDLKDEVTVVGFGQVEGSCVQVGLKRECWFL